MREARTLNQPSPLIAYTNVERELSLINLSLRQQLAGFDNCCKSLKSMVAQLRIIASYFENKLREYNKNVKTITTLVTDQEEELWFINWCSVCKWICEILCEALAWIVDPCKLCGAFGVFAPICYIICIVITAVLCYIGCEYICCLVGLCPC